MPVSDEVFDEAWAWNADPEALFGYSDPLAALHSSGASSASHSWGPSPSDDQSRERQFMMNWLHQQKPELIVVERVPAFPGPGNSRTAALDPAGVRSMFHCQLSDWTLDPDSDAEDAKPDENDNAVTAPPCMEAVPIPMEDVDDSMFDNPVVPHPGIVVQPQLPLQPPPIAHVPALSRWEVTDSDAEDADDELQCVASGPRNLLQGFAGNCTCVTRPPEHESAAWYMDFVFEHSYEWRHSHCNRAPRWPLVRDILCAGTCPELFSATVFQHRYGHVHVADSKTSAQVWILDHFDSMLSHAFVDNAAFTSGRGRCFKHGCDCPTAGSRVDLMSAGRPCRPFSQARDKTNVSVEQHPDLDTLMVGLPAYILSRRPRSFYFEEVPQLADLGPKGSACSYLALIGRKLSSLGYSVRAVKIDHKCFIRGVPRERLFVFCADAEGGGSEAVEWIRGRVMDTINLRLGAERPVPGGAARADKGAPSYLFKCLGASSRNYVSLMFQLFKCF